jgi:hypothetical protein
MPRARDFVRDNIFLLAAVALPVLVAGFFIVATAIPRWLVEPPGYDLLLTAAAGYDGTQARITVHFQIREGQVVAIAEAAPANLYQSPAKLFVFDHRSMQVRQIAIELPLTLPEGERREILVQGISGRIVAEGARAPDGYEFETRGSGGGIAGELFGMGRYRQNVAIAKNGRVVRIELPPPYQNPYYGGLTALGWVTSETAR